MFTALVKVEVHSETFDKLSKEEALDFIKKHMGYYSDYDTAKVVEVLEVNPLGK